MRAKHLWWLGLALFLTAAPAAAIESRLGVGVHLWRSAGDLWAHPGGGVRHDLAGILSYQLVLLRPLKLQLDVEYFPNGFGGAGLVAVFPQGLIVVGDRLYGAVGAGWIVPQDEAGNVSSVIYLARLGADFPVRARLRFDVFAEQRADELRGLKEGGADTVTFAMVLRLRL